MIGKLICFFVGHKYTTWYEKRYQKQWWIGGGVGGNLRKTKTTRRRTYWKKHRMKMRFVWECDRCKDRKKLSPSQHKAMIQKHKL